MQGLEVGHQGRDFRRPQVVPVRRHLPASLEHLADQLIAGKACCDSVERRTPLTAFTAESVAVAALFGLKYHSALTFKG